MKKYGKFAALIVVVIGTLVWLATAEMKDNQTYYKTITELGQMGNKAYTARVRVGGDVESGSIQRVGSRVEFVLAQETTKLKVAYTGTDPLPDTFKDGAQALADGKLGKDGVFVANRIQAKCASKYEAKPGQLKPGQDGSQHQLGQDKRRLAVFLEGKHGKLGFAGHPTGLLSGVVCHGGMRHRPSEEQTVSYS